MKSNIVIKTAFLLWSFFLFISCTKNDTNYFKDGEDRELSIFSNSGNNALSCYIKDKPWRTVPRIYSLGLSSSHSYEVYVRKEQDSLGTYLSFQLSGYFVEDINNTASLFFNLAVPSNFSYKDLSSLQGQRIQVDTTNGYFSFNVRGLNTGITKGTGNIYFHTASYDVIGPGIYGGNISGLFEANFSSFKIVKGRFDHAITPNQIRF